MGVNGPGSNPTQGNQLKFRSYDVKNDSIRGGGKSQNDTIYFYGQVQYNNDDSIPETYDPNKDNNRPGGASGQGGGNNGGNGGGKSGGISLER